MQANSKLTSTVRANFSHAIKKEFPVAYQFVCSDEGKVDKKKAKKLLDGEPIFCILLLSECALPSLFSQSH